jgi:hypothetical protein
MSETLVGTLFGLAIGIFICLTMMVVWWLFDAFREEVKGWFRREKKEAR